MKILITEEQFDHLVGFIYEQQSKPKVGHIGSTRISGGKAGLTRSEFKSQEEKKKQEQEYTIETEGIAKLFTEKMISDIGKRPAFKGLSTELKTDLMNSWFNEGGLPEDFFENIDDYRFRISHLGGHSISTTFEGDKAKDNLNTLNNLYQKLNKENFESYNGSSNIYNVIQTKPNTETPIFDGNNFKVGQIKMEGYKLMMIAPPVGGAVGDILTSSGTIKKVVVTTPPIPLSYGVESDTLSPDQIDILNKSLTDFINSNEDIKYANSKGINYGISDVKVISSASNTWNGRTLPFTHNNKGEMVNTTYDTSVQNATKNMTLAANRGNNLVTILKSDESIQNKLKLTPSTKFEVESIVTDTGGVTDETNKRNNTGLNPGQYVKFIFTVSYKEEYPGKEKGSFNLKYWIIELVKQKSERSFLNKISSQFIKSKYLKRGGKFKSSRSISRNIGKPFRGLGPWLDNILP